jgi:protein SCO1/2
MVAFRKPARELVGAALAVVAAVTAVGCSNAPSSSQPPLVQREVHTVAGGPTMTERVSPAIARIPLRDQDGQSVTLRSLHGKIVVLAPELTLCQETCPMTSANMHRAAQWAENGSLSGKVVFVELTVDPWRDTVGRLHAYEQLYGALPDWRLVTGEPRPVQKLWKAIGVSTDRVYGHDEVVDWMTGKVLRRPYDIHHQDVVFVFDPAGRIRWIRLGRPDARHDPALPGSMSRFLNDEGHQNYHAPGVDSWTAQDVEQAVRYVSRLPSGR